MGLLKDIIRRPNTYANIVLNVLFLVAIIGENDGISFAIMCMEVLARHANFHKLIVLKVIPQSISRNIGLHDQEKVTNAGSKFFKHKMGYCHNCGMTDEHAKTSIQELGLMKNQALECFTYDLRFPLCKFCFPTNCQEARWMHTPKNLTILSNHFASIDRFMDFVCQSSNADICAFLLHFSQMAYTSTILTLLEKIVTFKDESFEEMVLKAQQMSSLMFHFRTIGAGRKGAILDYLFEKYFRDIIMQAPVFFTFVGYGLEICPEKYLSIYIESGNILMQDYVNGLAGKDLIFDVDIPDIDMYEETALWCRAVMAKLFVPDIDDIDSSVLRLQDIADEGDGISEFLVIYQRFIRDN
jgi:hypothetical protein